MTEAVTRVADRVTDTKRVRERRTLHFSSLDDIVADMETLGRGPIETTGNWTSAQIVDHVGCVMVGALDGFDVRAPWLLRVVGRLLKKRFIERGFNAGFKLPASLRTLEPDPGLTWDAATGRLRAAVDRVRAGERMSFPSPVAGPLAHDEWVKLHCRHAEMHFGFMRAKEG